MEENKDSIKQHVFHESAVQKTDIEEMEVVTGEDLLNREVKEIPFLVDGLFQASGLAGIIGSSDTGKSAFLRQFASSLALGKKDFLGFKMNAKHNSSIYVSTEDDAEAMAALLFKQNAGKYPASGFKGLRFIFNSENLIKKLDSELTKAPADAVIIDAFTDIFGGELNIANKVRVFMEGYSNLAKKHKCLIVFLHHTGKRTELLPPSKDNAIGSQAFESKTRVTIELRKDFQVDEKRHLCIVKGNYIPSENKEKSFVLNFEDFFFSPTGERVSFGLLAKPQFKSGFKSKGNPTEAKDKACKMNQEGVSIREIKRKLKALGYNYGKTTIAIWVKNCPSVQLPIGKADTGQSNAKEETVVEGTQAKGGDEEE